MQRIITFGLLASLLLGCNAQVSNNASSPADRPPSNTASSNTAPPGPTNPVANAGQLIYTSVYGFSFTYPEGYTVLSFTDPEGSVVDASRDRQSPQANDALQGRLELWQQEDYEALQQHGFAGSEPPPNISIQVYRNLEQRPLKDWKGDLSQEDDRAITIAGQPAIAYSSTGLYESDNILLSSPDGELVIRLSAGYLEADSPIRQDLQAIANSFSFGQAN